MDEGRVQRPFVLFFSFLPQSTLQAGAPLPTPAAATAFIEALPPNQTPFVREAAARGSSAGTDAPVSPSKQTLSHPPSRRAAHPHRCHAACLGLLPSVQDGGHRALSPELHPCSPPDEHPGTPVWASEPLSAPGLPRHSAHPGRSWQVLLPRGCLHSCQGLPDGSALLAHNSHPTGNSRAPSCRQEPRAAGGRGSNTLRPRAHRG